MTRKEQGFTLIELLVVIAIIALLDGIVIAGCPVGSRSGPASPMYEQPQADRSGNA